MGRKVSQLCWHRGFPGHHLGELSWTRKNRDDTGETGIRDTHPRQVIRYRLRRRQPPEHTEALRELVRYETYRAQACISVRPRFYVGQRYCDRVPRLGPLDIDRSRQRVHRADRGPRGTRIIKRTLRVQVEIARVAYMEDDGLTRPFGIAGCSRLIQPGSSLHVRPSPPTTTGSVCAYPGAQPDRTAPKASRQRTTRDDVMCRPRLLIATAAGRMRGIDAGCRPRFFGSWSRGHPRTGALARTASTPTTTRDRSSA